MSQREPIGARFKPGVITSACVVLVGFFVILSFFMTDSLSAAETGPGKALKVTRITPSGADVPPGRQIVFEFNRPVVPLGRMERSASEIPISIEPVLCASGDGLILTIWRANWTNSTRWRHRPATT